MITRLDHFVLICPDLTVGADLYAALLGSPSAWRAEDVEAGTASAVFNVGNTALELVAPQGEGPVGARLREMLAETGPALTSLAYASDDLEADHHQIARRGLDVSDISESSSADSVSGARRTWRRFRCADGSMAGIKTFVLGTYDGELPEMNPDAGAVHALDHLVINTPNPDRAVAIYGARLGLRLALDRTAQEWKTRFLFFRLGELTLEVIHRLGQTQDPAGGDEIWGLTWAVRDLEAAQARLRVAGVNVSDIRKGRKPGSRVFTSRDGTLGIPTLFIAHEGT